MRRLVKILVVASMSLIITACNQKAENYSEEYSDVGTQEEKTETISFNGIVKAEEESSVISVLTGTVMNVYVKKGDIVEKGDKICKFNTSELQAELLSLEDKIEKEKSGESIRIKMYKENIENAKRTRNSKINTIKEQLCKTKKSYNEVQKEGKKYKDKIEMLQKKMVAYKTLLNETEDIETEALYNKTIEEKKSYEALYKESKLKEEEIKESIDNLNASYKLEVLEQDSLLDKAKYDLELYQNTTILEDEAQVKDLKKRIKDAEVLADCNGIITELNIEKGQNFSGGKIAVISGKEKYVVQGYLPEKNVFKVYPQDEVTIIPSYIDGDEITGRIEKISDVYDDENEGFLVEVSVGKKEDLRIGMNVKVRMEYVVS